MRCGLISALFVVLVAACADSADPQQPLGPDAAAAAIDARPSVDSAIPPMGTLKVATINLLHGFPGFENLDARTDIVIDWIVAEQPDIIAIQEAGQTPSMDNRGQIIADRTGYHWTWEKASGVDFVFEEGPGVLSKWPITTRDAVELPHPGSAGFEVRKAVGAQVTTPHGTVALFSTHLTTQDDEAVKADQAFAALELVNRDTMELPSFLAGDMNATPQQLPMRFLRGEASHKGMMGTLADAWLTANPNAEGYTNDPVNADARIDYIYVRDGSTAGGQVRSCEIILADAVGGIYASDHLGVSCEIDIVAR